MLAIPKQQNHTKSYDGSGAQLSTFAVKLSTFAIVCLILLAREGLVQLRQLSSADAQAKVDDAGTKPSTFGSVAFLPMFPRRSPALPAHAFALSGLRVRGLSVSASVAACLCLSHAETEAVVQYLRVSIRSLGLVSERC